MQLIEAVILASSSRSRTLVRFHSVMPHLITLFRWLVLQFIPQANRAIREMRRILRPGGIMAAATWDTRGGLVFYRMVLDGVH